MPRTIMFIPADTRVGLTSVILGVTRAIERKGISLSVFKPITQLYSGNDASSKITTILRKHFLIHISEPLSMEYIESLLSSDRQDLLMEEIIARYHMSMQNSEIILVEGLIPTQEHQFSNALNYEIAKALNAEIVFVITLGNDSSTQLKKRIGIVQNSFGGRKNKNISGIIINELNSPIDKHGQIRHNLPEILYDSTESKVSNIEIEQLFSNGPLPILGYIPWNFDLFSTRAIDMFRYLDAHIINEGDIQMRLVKSITFCVSSLPQILEHFRPSSLLVISADRPEILIAACLLTMNGVEIGAILLTEGYKIDNCIYKICERAFQTGLPVFTVNTDIWQTSIRLQNFNLEEYRGDIQYIKNVQEYVARCIKRNWVESLTTTANHSHRLSPIAFRYHLIELAQKLCKRIVLPEGEEPRTVKAASICGERGIAQCILLGNLDKIQSIAKNQGFTLGNGIEIIDPKEIRKNYVARLVELRKNKGMTEVVAKKKLEDNVVLGTMMLERDEVDGLVSGAIHTTANTIRPPLQLIKTASNSSLISSIFFMLLPEQVLVYGDCAINPNPTAEQLSEIAIQSADAAASFGIEPRVAMISYSTGDSGGGDDVEKVRKATYIAQKKRPDLLIDGPLQYDAAIVEDVAKLKAPTSQVAGHATVFIFPDLNTGNTTYKAVQRSADLISIGPILLGMRKPVNDLSRGALVNDIIYTIAMTAIQASREN